MKKRLDYKSKKFVITAVLIAIIAAVAIVGTVAFIKSNNNIQAIIEETTDNQNNINENQNKVDDSTKDNNVVSNTSTINVNNFETLKETTIIEYKDVEKVSEKSKTIGWKPNAFELNIENIIGVNKTRIEIVKAFVSYIDNNVNNDSALEREISGVEKEATEDTVVGLGDILTYKVTVTNTGNQTVNNVKVFDTIVFGEDGSLLEKTIEEILPGESASVEFIYEVTEEDILNGQIENSAFAVIEDGIPEEIEEPVIVPTEDVDKTFVVEKILLTVNGSEEIPEKVYLNDKLVYEIIVTNKGNVSLENLVVEDTLNEAVLVEGYSNVIEKLAPGASEYIQYEYVVVEEDVKSGCVINSAVVTVDDTEKEPEEPVETPVNQEYQYTVKHIEKETGIELHEAQVFDSTYGTKIKGEEQKIEIKGYVYNSVNKDNLVVGVDESANIIEVYYTKRTDLSYTVNYIEKDTDTKLKESKVVNNQTYLSSVTEEAVEIVGYNKVAPTSATITIDVEGNVINFYYTKRTDLSYTVNYLEKGTDTKLKESKVVDGQVYLSSVTEEAVDIAGYNKVAPTSATITINVEDNVINFYYTKKTDLQFVVNHLDEETDEVLHTQYVGTATYQDKVYASDYVETISGYNYAYAENEYVVIDDPDTNNILNLYYTKRTDLSYTVNYLEKGTDKKVKDSKVVDGQKYLSSVTETAVDVSGYNKVDPTSATITIQVEGNVINFYYTKRTDLSYIVNYYEVGTTTSVYPSKTVNDQTYLDEVTENAVDVLGYNKVEPTSATITIQVEGNVINFYYTKKTDLQFVVNYLDEETDEVLHTQYVGTATYQDKVYASDYIETISGYNYAYAENEYVVIDDPDTNNILNLYYTKRTDLSYTVNYLEKGTDTKLKESKVVEGQKYLSSVTENAVEIKGYNKVDPTSATITIQVEGNVINFYYTKKTDLQFVVNYLEKETGEVLHDQYVDNGIYQDKVYSDNYIEDIPGYNTGVADKEFIVIEDPDTDNVINIYYTKRTDLSYTVNYLEKGTETKLKESKVVNNQTYLDEVTENAVEIEGYNKVEPTSDTITIDVEGNVINFYYTKRTDLSYIVNYYEEGTTTSVHPSKTVDNQTYLDEVTENAVDVPGYNKVAPTSAKITINVEDNVINFYYTKRTDLSYIVNYYEEGTTSSVYPSKTVDNQTYLDEVTENAVDVPGYNKVAPTSATITIQVEGNVINFYYTKRTDLSYTVNYLEKGTDKKLKESKVVDGQVYLSSVTEEAADIAGYNKVAPTSATITIDVEDNVINFYYTKRTDLSYIVNYYEKGTTISVHPSKTVNNQTYLDKITENAVDVPGYNKEVPTSVTITIQVEGNVINFYYTKKADLQFVVNYLDEETDEVLHTQYVGTATYQDKVYASDYVEIISGYNYAYAENEYVVIGSVEANNVLNLYYTKRTDLSYIVNYYEKGTTKSVHQSKTVDNQTYLDEVTENAVDVPGYNKVAPTSTTITINVEDNVINFYYTKKTDLQFVVNYLDEETDEVLHTQYVGTATYQDKVYASDYVETISGYNYAYAENEYVVIDDPDTNNILNLYYTKRTDLSYTVNYLEKGTDTKLKESKVVDGQKYLSSVTEEAADIAGYNKVAPTSVTITINVEDNVINFYYTKRTDLSYTVNYYEEGTTTSVHPSKVVNGKTYLDEVTENAVDVPGYNKVEPTSATITINVEDNVINFYYTKRTDLSYTVNYYEEGTTTSVYPSKTVDDQTYLDEVTENAVTVEGYDKVDPTSATITIGLEDNVINFYYTKKANLSYTVNYYEEGTVNKLKESKVVDGQIYLSSVTEEAAEIVGYNKVAPTTVTITIKEDGNIINFYYTKKDDLSYIVNYYEEGTTNSVHPSKTVNNQTYLEEVTENAVDVPGYNKVAPTSATIIIQVEDNVINFYYTKRTDLSYTVNYLEKGTNIPLADAKVVNNQEFGASVTETAKAITGYNAVDPTSQTITIKIEDNVINFYYERTIYSYTVNYLEKGTNTPLKAAKVVEDVVVGTVITSRDEVVEISGYTYNSVDKNTLTITSVEANNVINIYYERVNVSLTKMAVDAKGKEVTPLYKYSEGDTVRYKLTITNNGTSTLNSYTVTDTLPNELRFDGTQPAGTSVNGKTLTWTITNLAGGASKSITIVTKINNDSWSSSPQDTYHSRDGVMLANGTEITIRQSDYRGDTKTKYDNNENYINCSFYIYNSQAGEVPFENGSTQYNGGYTAVGFGRVSGIAFNSALRTIENLNNVIDTHNLVQDKIVYAPNYNPGDGKIVLWYVSKTIRGTEETFNGKKAYITYHVDGIVVDLNNVYAVTNRITGSDGKTSNDIVLVVDDSLTSTGITSNDTVRPIATTLRMVKSMKPTNIIENEEANTLVEDSLENEIPENNVLENTVPENTVPENTVTENTVTENTVPENTVPENTVPENTIPENTVPENTVPENTIPENNVVENTITEIIGNAENTVFENPVIEEVIIPNTEIKESEENANV